MKHILDLFQTKGSLFLKITSTTIDELIKLPQCDPIIKEEYEKFFREYSQQELIELQKINENSYYLDNLRMRIEPSSGKKYQEFFNNHESKEFRNKLNQDIKDLYKEFPKAAFADQAFTNQKGIIWFGMRVLRMFLVELCGINTDGQETTFKVTKQNTGWQVVVEVSLFISLRENEDRDTPKTIHFHCTQQFNFQPSNAETIKISFDHANLHFSNHIPFDDQDQIMLGIYSNQTNSIKQQLQNVLIKSTDLYQLPSIPDKINLTVATLLQNHFNTLPPLYKKVFLAKLSPFAQESSNFRSSNEFILALNERLLIDDLPKNVFKISRNPHTFLLDLEVNFSNINSKLQTAILETIANRHYSSITLRDCKELINRRLETILNKNSELTHLEIDNCEPLPSDMIKTLQNKCPNLKELIFINLDIKQLHLPHKLDLLTIFSCDSLENLQLNKEKIGKITISDCPKLNHLTLPAIIDTLKLHSIPEINENNLAIALENRSINKVFLPENIPDRFFKERLPLSDWPKLATAALINTCRELIKPDCSQTQLKFTTDFKTIDIRILGVALSINSSVTSLDLSNSERTLADIEFLSLGLKSNHTLQTLNLAHNQFSPANVLIRCLHRKTGLIYIDLSKTNISFDSLLNIVKHCLLHDVNLTINISHNQFTADTIEQLIELHAINRYLFHFNSDNTLQIVRHFTNQNRVTLISEVTQPLLDSLQEICSIIRKTESTSLKDMENIRNALKRFPKLLPIITVDDEFNSILHLAIKYSKHEITLLLLAHLKEFSIPTRKNKNDQEPLDIIMQTFPNLVTTKDTNLDSIKDTDVANFYLLKVIKETNQITDETIRAIKNCLLLGANLTAKTENGNTALHLAIQKRQKPLVIQLATHMLHNNISLDCTNDGGTTPLNLAIGDAEIHNTLENFLEAEKVQTQPTQKLTL